MKTISDLTRVVARHRALLQLALLAAGLLALGVGIGAPECFPLDPSC